MPTKHIMERRLKRSWTVIGLWLIALLLAAGQASWGVWQSSQEAEERLLREVGLTAARVAAILSLPGVVIDGTTAGNAVEAAMNDERVYGITVQGNNGFFFGQRRNHYWEPVAWDDEITDYTVQGMSPVKQSGTSIGTVEIYMSRRMANEEHALATRRELIRFALSALFYTALLLGLLHRYGDLARIWRMLRVRWTGQTAETEQPQNAETSPALPGEKITPQTQPGVIDLDRGKLYMRTHPDTITITASLFHQTFRTAPSLMSRLYAHGAFPELSHLGRLLEQAAPCIGAAELQQAAHDMQQHLNDPQILDKALAVERCTGALDTVLLALEA